MSISIIIPIYQVEDYIEECLQSVFLQENTIGLECILIDDCGVDGSILKAEHLIASYHGKIQFKILHHKKNRGLSAARNTGIQAASGDYILFLDGDDLLTRDAIKVLGDSVEKENFDVVCGSFIVKSEKPNHWKEWRQELLTSRNPQDIIRFYTNDKLYMMAWNKLVRRDILIKHNILFMEGIIHEDELWSYILIHHITSLTILPNKTYVYRIREHSIMTSSKKNYSIDCKIKIMEEIHLLNKNKLITQCVEDENYFRKHQFYLAIDILEDKSLLSQDKRLFLQRIVLLHRPHICIYSMIKYLIKKNGLLCIQKSAQK